MVSGYEPMERLTSSAVANSVEIATPIVGETILYGKIEPVAKWWQKAMVKSENSEIAAKN
jgi:hypothetical protein